MQLPKHYRHNPLLAKAIERNIETLAEIERQMSAGRTQQDRIADAITRFFGSMAFVYFHVAWFVVWVVLNQIILGPDRAFDPFPYGLLTMIVSLEAIFLSTFVLITQNRQAVIADKRADLDLQINLIAEHEITKILKLVDALADHFKLSEGKDHEIDELKRNVSPDSVLEEMEMKKGEMHSRENHGRRDTGPSTQQQ